jgi:hypothetical protein
MSVASLMSIAPQRSIKLWYLFSVFWVCLCFLDINKYLFFEFSKFWFDKIRCRRAEWFGYIFRILMRYSNLKSFLSFLSLFMFYGHKQNLMFEFSKFLTKLDADGRNGSTTLLELSDYRAWKLPLLRFIYLHFVNINATYISRFETWWWSTQFFKGYGLCVTRWTLHTKALSNYDVYFPFFFCVCLRLCRHKQILDK